MLLPILGAGAIAGIGAGANVLSQGINALVQSGANKKNWKRAREAYTIERRDNLADWNMQNAYNHPSEQMKRLKEAGLNPNMVYGNGNAITTAQPVKNANQEAPTVNPIQLDLGGIVQQFIQAQQLQQQTDNLREINKLLELQQQEKNLKNVLTDLNISRQDRALRMDDLKLAAMPGQINLGLEAMRLKNAQTTAQTTYTLNENQRRALLTTQSLKEGLKRLYQMDLDRAYTRVKMAQGSQQIAESKQRVQNLQKALQLLDKDGSIKDFEIELNRRGVSKSDPYYLRAAATIKSNLDKKYELENLDYDQYPY